MGAAEQGEDVAKVMPQNIIKPLHKIIADHKDVVKIVIQLNAIVSTFKSDVLELLETWACYGELWEGEIETKVKEFMDSNPIMTEIENQLRQYNVSLILTIICVYIYNSLLFYQFRI